MPQNIEKAATHMSENAPTSIRFIMCKFYHLSTRSITSECI